MAEVPISSSKRIWWNEISNIFLFLFPIIAEADADFQARMQARGFSETDISEKDKPSKIISSLENAVTDTVQR